MQSFGSCQNQSAGHQNDLSIANIKLYVVKISKKAAVRKVL